MNTKETFKQLPNMTEEEKKELGDKLMSAFEYINITYQKARNEIVAIEFTGRISFKKKGTENGEKIQKRK